MIKEVKMLFENTDVEIIKDGNALLFEVYSTGKALGYVTKSKDREYPHKIRIDRTIKNAELSTVVRGVQQFLTLDDLFDFMLEAHTEKCKSFRKWITTDVVPTINETGGYVAPKEEAAFIESYFPDLSEETKKSMILDLKRKGEEKDKVIAALKPDADMANEIIKKQGLLTLKQVADTIEIGRTNLCSLLRQKMILSKQSGYNEPMGKYIKSSYFKTVIEENEKTKHVSIVTLVTPKGLKFIYRLIKKNELLDEFNTTLLEVQPHA